MPKDIKRKDTRVSRDAVTGQLESVVLDDVQQALEKCLNYIDARMLEFGSDNAKCHELARKIAMCVLMKRPHTDADLLEGGTSLDRAEATLEQTGE